MYGSDYAGAGCPVKGGNSQTITQQIIEEWFGVVRLRA